MLIAQITDLHAGDPVAGLDPHLAPTTGVRRAVRHLNAMRPRPACVMITGDLVAEERLERYEALATVLRGLEVPFYVIPGNHDDRALIRSVFGASGAVSAESAFLHFALDMGDLRLVALDTHDPGREGGLLCPARLAWLEGCLAEAADRPTIGFIHHPRFATGIEKFDEIGLSNSAAFDTVPPLSIPSRYFILLDSS